MNLQFYRVFVERTEQLSLLDDTKTSKRDLLYEAFNVRTPLYFNHYKQRLAYVAQKEAGDYILGTMGKVTHVNVQKSPEEDFENESIESWPHVPLLINISSDPEMGQSIAIGYVKSVFDAPISQLKSLCENLTKATIKKHGYQLVVHPITHKQDFWEIVKANKGSVTTLSFDFAAPNLFNTKNSLNDELREAKTQFGITSARINLENEEGKLKVPGDSTFVKEGLDYISAGGGEYKIKFKNKRTVTSKDATRSITVDETELEIAGKQKSQLEAFCDKLFLWLKRSE